LTFFIFWGKQKDTMIVRRDETAEDWANLKDRIKNLYKGMRNMWPNEKDFGIWVRFKDQTNMVEFDGPYAGGL